MDEMGRNTEVLLLEDDVVKIVDGAWLGGGWCVGLLQCAGGGVTIT